MTMQPNEYWRARSLELLDQGEVNSMILISRIDNSYNQSLKQIDKLLDSVYKNYGEKGIIPVSRLKEPLTANEIATIQARAIQIAKQNGIPTENVFDERYLSRASRLEGIREQIKQEIQITAYREQKLSENTYEKIVKQSYTGSGEVFELALNNRQLRPKINTQVAGNVLGSYFAGGNYSDLIWKNTGQLSEQLPSILSSAMLSGESYAQTTRTVSERFGVASSDAKRLVLTENSYFVNGGELQAYNDYGVAKYTYDAVRDSRTSDICSELDGQIYELDKAEIGKNYPPMHPYCRSVTSPLFEGEPDIKPDANNIWGNPVESYAEELRFNNNADSQNFNFMTGNPTTREYGSVQVFKSNSSIDTFLLSDINESILSGVKEIRGVGTQSDYTMTLPLMPKAQRRELVKQVSMEYMTRLQATEPSNQSLSNMWADIAQELKLGYSQRPLYTI